VKAVIVEIRKAPFLIVPISEDYYAIQEAAGEVRATSDGGNWEHVNAALGLITCLSVGTPGYGSIISRRQKQLRDTKIRVEVKATVGIFYYPNGTRTFQVDFHKVKTMYETGNNRKARKRRKWSTRNMRRDIRESLLQSIAPVMP
jgi:hypothetical protein